MKGVLEFLKTTVIGGLFVLLPVLLFYLLLAQALPMVIALAEPLALLLPDGALDQAKAKVLMALILIVVSSFLIGLALRLAAGRRLGAWVEGNLLMRLPSYAVVKRLVRGVAGDTEGGAFKPAVLVSWNGVREVVFVIEDPGDKYLTVLVPRAPTPFTGSVKIVPREQVEPLDAGLGDVTRTLGHWGVGLQDLVAKRKSGHTEIP
jgi:uncharacterized membrane protein